jgi:MFS family permease
MHWTRFGASVAVAIGAPGFRWYLAGMIVFGLVQTMNRFVLPYLAYEASHSSAILGFVGFALALPTLLLSPIGGVWADRIHRLRLIRLTQIGWLALFSVFAIVFVSGSGSLPVIVLVAVVSGALLAFDQPARQALVAGLVPAAGLSSAYGLIAASWNVSGLVGPSLAAALLAVAFSAGLGAAPLLALTALGSGAMVFMTTRVAEPPLAPRSAMGSRWWQDMAVGMRFVAETPVVAALVVLAFAISVLAFSSVFLMPAFAAEVFGEDIGRLGLLVSAWGAGALVGIIVVIFGVWDPRRGAVARWAPLALGVVLVAFAISRSFELSLFLIAVAGGLAMTYLTVAQSALQLLIPNELRGRVMGIYVLNFAISPLGATVLGVLGSRIGTAPAVGVGALVLGAIAAAVLLRVPQLANMD